MSQIRSIATIHRSKAGRGASFQEGRQKDFSMSVRAISGNHWRPKAWVFSHNTDTTVQTWALAFSLQPPLHPHPAHSNMPYLALWNIKKKERKNVLQITLHKIQQMVHCNLTWNRSRERGRLARLCINNQCSLIFKNIVSQDCIQDDRQPFLRMWSRRPRELWNCVLKAWMLRDKKGFQNTGTQQCGGCGRSHFHTVL